MTPEFYARLAELPEEQQLEFDSAGFTPKEKGHLMMHRILFLTGHYAEDSMPRVREPVNPSDVPKKPVLQPEDGYCSW